MAVAVAVYIQIYRLGVIYMRLCSISMYIYVYTYIYIYIRMHMYEYAYVDKFIHRPTRVGLT